MDSEQNFDEISETDFSGRKSVETIVIDDIQAAYGERISQKIC